MANYSSEVYYTLSFTKNASNTTYANNYEVTVNDKKWSVPGNQNYDKCVKIGGKSITNAVRRIYSIDALSANIGKIVIDHGSKDSNLTFNKLEINVYSSVDDCKNETNPVLTKKGAYEADKENVIELDRISGYDSLYYSIDYTLSNSKTSNAGLYINSIKFYEFENDISEIAKNDIKAETTKAQLKYSFDVVQGEGVSSFVKVTEAPTNWSGEYLIVYEGGSLVFDGSLTTLDASNNTQSVDIIDNKIENKKEIEKCSFKISGTNDNYTISSASNYYIGNKSDSNALSSDKTELYTNKIEFNEDSTINIISSGGAYLRYNATSGQERFRYYKSSTYTGQKAICLYKYVDPNTYTFHNMKMNLGAIIETSKVQALMDAGLKISSYGVAVAQKLKLDGSTISDAIINKSSYVSVVSQGFTSLEALQKTDASGTAKEGNYVIFTANLPIPDTKFTEDITSVAYFLLDDGTYVFLQERTCSVKSLAQAYVDNKEVYNNFDSNIQGSLKALAALTALTA